MPPRDLFYKLSLKSISEKSNGEGMYDPEVGDLTALTETRHKCIDDINTPKRLYLIAVVFGGNCASDKVCIYCRSPLL